MIRNDVTVDWAASPRIIWVAAPSIEITMQDLRDTLRSLEMSEEGILYAPLLESSGKQNLGGGVLVGLTIKLLNAKLAFEARLGPAWIVCLLTGGNCVAVDADGENMEVMHPTAFVSSARAASSSATLVGAGGAASPEDIADEIYNDPRLPSVPTVADIVDGVPSVSDIVDGVYADPRLPDVPEVTEIVNGIYADPRAINAEDLETRLVLIERILRNKLVTDPVTGIMTLYNDAGVPLMQAQMWEDVDATQRYRGQGADRRERLESVP